MSSAGQNQKQTTSLVLRRHRTSTEKVRTGCITCKRRHIKCDEAKPHCSNCLKSRGHCEGYAPEGTTTKKKSRSTKSPGPAQIVWDSMQQVTGHEAAAVAQQKLPLYVNPNSPDFQDDAGTRYFGEFVDLVHATSSISASNGNLWAVIMPQLAHDNQTLRYAAMAIGALSKWHSQTTKSQALHAVSVQSFPSVKEGDAHYYNAVAYYCRSLKLQNQQASLQDAVFLSLLLLFFEVLRGNRKAALDHVNHGLALLLILTTDQDAHDSVAKFATNPMPLIASVADVFTYLAPQALMILRGKFGQSPPLPNFMKRLKDKNRTMGSFMVLLSQLPRSSPVSSRIPVVFTSLDEFEHVWISFQREHTAINLIMRELIQESKDRGFDGKDFFESFHLDVLKSSRLQEFCARSREVLKVLDTAYLPLFNQIMMSENTESPVYLKAIYLRLQHLGLYIFDDPAIFLDIEALQSRTPLFREFLFLADIVLRAAKQRTKNPAHQLSLQCVLTLHLLSVSMHCRDPLVRDQAMWMLKDYPGQDGLFSTRSMYLIALKNRAVERINASEGTLMEQLQRLWRREFIFEDGGDRIVVRYMDKDEVTHIWQVVEETVDVQGDPENAVWSRRQLSGFGTPLLADFFSD